MDSPIPPLKEQYEIIQNLSENHESHEGDTVYLIAKIWYDNWSQKAQNPDETANPNEIEQIERSIDERIKGLRELMTKWVDAKYSQEMEDFSEKFRKMKKNNDFDGNIFEISLKFKKDDDEECDALIKRLMPYLPSMDSPINFDKDKMIQLLNLVPNDTTVLSMDELLKLAEEVGFSEEELAELEITITMSTIPDFIDIKEFGSSFSKDEL